MSNRKRAVNRGWPAHLLKRLDKLRRRLADDKLDALLLSCPMDVRYATGFPGEDSWAVVLPQSVVILSDRRFEEELSHLRYCRVKIRSKTSLSEELGKVVKQARVKRLGLQAEHVTLSQRAAIARQVGAKRLKPVGGWLLEQRAIKDDHEVALLRKAVRIQEQAFEALKRQIKPGLTESHVAGLLEFEMRQRGAAGPSFPLIVGAGANGSIPHYMPGNVKLKNNSTVLIDFGALYEGYHSDMTRVLALGRMPRKLAEVYKIVEESQRAGIEAIGPGVSLKDVDAAARKVIVKAGYGKQFSHSLGHGIGLQIHEEPRLSSKAKGELKPGHVVTVEPGIYLPGIGGVRLEDDILVTARGRQNLCTLPTDIGSAMI